MWTSMHPCFTPSFLPSTLLSPCPCVSSSLQIPVARSAPLTLFFPSSPIIQQSHCDLRNSVDDAFLFSSANPVSQPHKRASAYACEEYFILYTRRTGANSSIILWYFYLTGLQILPQTLLVTRKAMRGVNVFLLLIDLENDHFTHYTVKKGLCAFTIFISNFT